MGASGCGKSTLLYLLDGLDRPSGGEIWLDGKDIPPPIIIKERAR
jgi:putative ABC transport system ATP-binding protein